jgi:hypothetical protein
MVACGEDIFECKACNWWSCCDCSNESGGANRAGAGAHTDNTAAEAEKACDGSAFSVDAVTAVEEEEEGGETPLTLLLCSEEVNTSRLSLAPKSQVYTLAKMLLDAGADPDHRPFDTDDGADEYPVSAVSEMNVLPLPVIHFVFPTPNH